MLVGIVAIGRNEGDRLHACLVSALRAAPLVVYVDSGSSDGSVELARSLGAAVVQLDLTTPFTAARARNDGFEKLAALAPDVEFVQFVDGDCEIVKHWVERALAEMQARPQAAGVCGRRRERFASATTYNTLCDIEWNTPIGKARSCGGDALIRVRAFREVGGYNPSVIAGEEPEMCVRLRAAGWDIWRIDADMTLHDAAMTTFRQWWRRSVRSGHAYAEGFAMHGAPPERHYAKQVRSIWAWSLALPVAMGSSVVLLGFVAPRFSWIPLLGLSLYLLLIAKTAMWKRRQALSMRDALLYAFFVVLGKVPQLFGMLKYRASRAHGRRSALIEYKTAGPGKVAPINVATRANTK